MRKSFFFIVLFLLLVYSAHIFGQPLPGDPQLSGNAEKPVGGGADLAMNMKYGILLPLIYISYKYRSRISDWIAEL
jgi:hypothetical protein